MCIGNKTNILFKYWVCSNGSNQIWCYSCLISTTTLEPWELEHNGLPVLEYLKCFFVANETVYVMLCSDTYCNDNILLARSWLVTMFNWILSCVILLTFWSVRLLDITWRKMNVWCILSVLFAESVKISLPPRWLLCSSAILPR